MQTTGKQIFIDRYFYDYTSSVTDINGEYVAGDKKFHSCGNRTTLDIDTESDDTYLLLATTVGKLEIKHRGLYH
uniref:Uncharacterized protein n=1 Tax=Rhizophagus irregularis (strain DAOM 181602 / DAOM 197198 / MUCL 43194) TaxID=747089 RepID=U9T8F4_RHIID